MIQACPKCGYKYSTRKSMAKKEDIKLSTKRFKERHPDKVVKVFMTLFANIKQNHGLTADQYIEFLGELEGFTNKTLLYIANYLSYRINQFSNKNISYLIQTVRNMVAEPRKVYRTERMRINK